MRSLKSFYWNYLYEIRRSPSQWYEAFCFWIAWHLPDTVVSCCHIRVFCAITIDNPKLNATEVTCADALQYWYNKDKTKLEVVPEEEITGVGTEG